MKFIALSALIATTNAALGDDCYYDATVCKADGLECSTWTDSQYGEMASCEDCSEGNKQITDSYGDPVTYKCPAKATDGTTTPPTTPSAPPSGEEKASTIAMSAAVLLAASVLMA